MEQRKSFMYAAGDTARVQPVEGDDRFAIAGAPIIAAGDVCGSIMFISDNTSAYAGDIEQKLISTAAAFLGKQMEE
jgi:AbrB family transcriptional regulator (stage V sporulation protein T)